MTRPSTDAVPSLYLQRKAIEWLSCHEWPAPRVLNEHLWGTSPPPWWQKWLDSL
jgi:hypothetical protein